MLNAIFLNRFHITHPYPLYLLLLLLATLSGCADDDFFQHDAKATPAEIPASMQPGPDSAWVIAGRHYDRSYFFRLLWGDHYRNIWATPVKLPIFNLKKVKGGLEVQEAGGGFQTTSFHLQDSLGRIYAFRSVDKDPAGVVSKFWRKTFVADILRDQTSAANPYGALVVPELAKAVGVYHTSPAIYYVATNDTSFGEFAPQVQGKLFLLEEKFKSEDDLLPGMSAGAGFEDSDDALRLRFSTNTHHFNQKAFAKARLLDILIGDWDRHKDQWAWEVVKQGTDTYFEPVPKDRDQVFFKMNDGLIPAVATSKLFARKLHSFGPKPDDVPAYMINGSFMDKRLLNELDAEDWLKIAHEMQAKITDGTIEKAAKQLPPPVYKLVGEALVRSLKARRDSLPQIAREMYAELAEEVIIPGSDAEEKYEIKRLENNRTEVSIWRKASDHAPKALLYHRVFSGADTKRITLYSLAADDEITVTGHVAAAIPLAIYGGIGEDEIQDHSTVKGRRKMTKIYDTERGNDLYFGTEAEDRTTRDVRVHAFDREGK